MERTTLTRNLGPLTRQGLIAEKQGVDRREHILFLTIPGRKKLAGGFVCWTSAQQAFLKGFGEDRLEELRELLQTAADVSKSAVSPRSRRKTRIEK